MGQYHGICCVVVKALMLMMFCISILCSYTPLQAGHQVTSKSNCQSKLIKHDPGLLIQCTMDAILQKTNSAQGDREVALLKNIQSLLFPNIDFDLIAYLIFKNQIKNKQKQNKDFMNQFVKLVQLDIGMRYSKTISSNGLKYNIQYHAAQFHKNKGNGRSPKSEVSVSTTSHLNKKINLKYKFYDASDKKYWWKKTPHTHWKIYDIVISKISLLRVYRNQFAEEFKKNKKIVLKQSMQNKKQLSSDVLIRKSLERTIKDYDKVLNKKYKKRKQAHLSNSSLIEKFTLHHVMSSIS